MWTANSLRHLALALLVLLGSHMPGWAQVRDSGQIRTAGATCVPTNCVEVDMSGLESVSIDVDGAGTYDLAVEALANNQNTWRAINAIQESNLSLDSTLTAPGLWLLNNHGFVKVRIRAETLTVGTPTVTITRGYGLGGVASGAGGGGGGGDASLVEQEAQTAHLLAIELATEATEVATESIAGAVYPEGTSDATPTGVLSMWWDDDEAARAVSGAFPLPVNIVQGSLGGTFPEGEPFSAGATGVHVLHRSCGTTPTLGSGVVDGDRAIPCLSDDGAQYVTIVAPGGAVPEFAVDATQGAAVVSSGPQNMLSAVAHGANPTAVSAGQAARALSNRAGIPFMIGGHPNVLSSEAQVQDADGAQTNAALVTVGAGTQIVVTRAYAVCDASTTAGTQIVLGFGAATLPARAHTGVAGIILAGDGHAPGGGLHSGDGSGIIAIGADGEDLRLTTEDPAGGACSVGYTYYTIESA